MKRRGKIAVSFSMLGMFVALSYSSLSTREVVVSSSAQQAWQRGDMALALSRYQDVADGRGDSELHRYNKGTVLAALSLQGAAPAELSLALRLLREASEQAGSHEVKASALYNAGTALLLAGRLSESIPFLRRSIVADPQQERARINLNLALRKIAREKQEGGKGGAKGGATTKGEEDGAKGGVGESRSGEGAAGTESEGVAPKQGQGTIGREASAGAESASEGGAEFGSQTPIAHPDTLDDLGLQQKLEALERRSGELRRAGLLRKSSGIAKKFQQAGD